MLIINHTLYKVIYAKLQKKKIYIKFLLKYLHIFSFAEPFYFYKICDVMHFMWEAGLLS